MSKSAVVYFSVYGGTERLAEEIAHQTGSDIIEIVPITKYDSDKNHYEILTKIAEIEKNGNQRPAIEKIDISAYDQIFLGYPIWWYTMPMAVYTFLETHDFHGKTVIPFLTHEGSRESTTYETLKEKCEGATILEGLDIFGSKMVFDQSLEVEEWLQKLGIK